MEREKACQAAGGCGTSFLLGLLMATMHPFLCGTADVERLDASLVHAAGGQPTRLQLPNLRR
jgi:hypothetical protein